MSVTERFIEAYEEAILWTSEKDDDFQAVKEDWFVQDFAPESLEIIKEDCEAFLERAGDDIFAMGPERAGVDFWLTRCGHGAGFWDGTWPEEIGKRLTEISKKFGEQTAYVDSHDRKVYLD